MDMGDNRPRPPGLEYRYRFETTDSDEIITEEIRSTCSSVLSGGKSAFVLEFRTSFIQLSKKGDVVVDEVVLGSQSFKTYTKEEGFVGCVCRQAKLMLQEDSWMPDQIQELAQDALDFARSTVVVGPPPRVVPMVVWFDVCTVQPEVKTVDWVVRDDRSRPGFEYRYRFQTTDTDEIITDKQISDFSWALSRVRNNSGGFVLGFRTNFLLKTWEQEEEEKVLGSESFRTYMDGSNSEVEFVEYLRMQADPSLEEEYRMPDELIQKLYHDAFDLAKSMMVDSGPPRVIPVVVWVDVCTVQRDDEYMREAMGRAIRARAISSSRCTDDDEDENLLKFLAWQERRRFFMPRFSEY